MEEAGRDLVTLLRHDLERRFDSDGVIQIHEARAEVSSGQGLHIVSEDGATAGTIGPEPDEWDSVDRVGLQNQGKQGFHEIVDGAINRPARKTQSVPTSQVQSLEML